MSGWKEKNSAFCMDLEIRHSWRSGCTVGLSVGSGGPGGKALEKFMIFSLSLSWYSLSEILKLKLSASNKKTAIMI